ncbi:hypothetical protein M3A49_04640 [Paraburkholderia sp. CNPSo 3076]|uniref:hypothetical protein n=1 Tax=Paraburkholderia sp. CNPSo 3076 TaxID=2940936 RepID=UPI0022596BD1|nr:hypothetical protein [Paraburkholderia sp. CNPSo 3076]MCX5538789.1 hypothetical protein [Paraburkholderia sp. CNPSo 3076]
MTKGIILALSMAIPLVFFNSIAHAEGSVSYSELIVPMFKQRPIFGEFIQRSFTVTDTGWGIRINSPTLPHMRGARMGPYRFQATWHSPKGDVPVMLIVDTKIQFFDSHHHEIVGSDLRKTTSITETLDSIEIEPPRAP